MHADVNVLAIPADEEIIEAFVPECTGSRYFSGTVLTWFAAVPSFYFETVEKYDTDVYVIMLCAG